jgi:hypothetical protein
MHRLGDQQRFLRILPKVWRRALFEKEPILSKTGRKEKSSISLIDFCIHKKEVVQMFAIHFLEIECEIQHYTIA